MLFVVMHMFVFFPFFCIMYVFTYLDRCSESFKKASPLMILVIKYQCNTFLKNRDLNIHICKYKNGVTAVPSRHFQICVKQCQ